MNCSSVGQQLTGCIVTLVVGLVGVAAATPGMAHPDSEEPLLMAQSSDSIAGSWRLVSMGEPASPVVVPQATELTADFSGDRISGSGGCNRFMGGYQTNASKLSIGPLGSTFMACEDAVMNQEMRYLAALQGAQRYEVDNQAQLTIFYQTDQGSGVLRFTSQTIRGLW